jgi:protein-tyrosine kinase
VAGNQAVAFERVDARYAGKIVVDEDISGESREQYRRLAASLHHAQAASGIRVVMLSSAVMGEGKTLTSSNLALTLSESYHKQVLLIDADLRRPTLHSLFRIRTGAGLSEGLMHPTGEMKIPVHQISSRLAILAAGRPTSNPIAGLTSIRMRQLLDEARGTFDWVIVDTPPVALLPDANLLSAMVDGAVLVVRAESTPWDLVQRAAGAIGQDRLLGVVLNGATAEAGSGYYGYDYYSDPQATTTPST